MYDGSDWHDSTNYGIGLKGDGPDGQGHATVLVDWDAYTVMTVGWAINASEGWVCDLYWQASASAAGASDIQFQETRLLAGLCGAGSYEIPSTWTDTTVTVQ
jgi:hypothetical protein